MVRVLGIGCNPVLIKGEKEQFIDWLSWGVDIEAIEFPPETGSIRWPSLSLTDIRKIKSCFQRPPLPTVIFPRLTHQAF